MMDLEAMFALIVQTLRENGEINRAAIRESGAMDHFMRGLEFEQRQRERIRRAGLAGALIGMAALAAMTAVTVTAVIYFSSPGRLALFEPARAALRLAPG